MARDRHTPVGRRNEGLPAVMRSATAVKILLSVGRSTAGADVWVVKPSTALPHPASIGDVGDMPGRLLAVRYPEETPLLLTVDAFAVFASMIERNGEFQWRAKVFRRNTDGDIAVVRCDKKMLAQLSSWVRAGKLKLDPPMTATQVNALPTYAQCVLLIEAYRQGLKVKGFS